MKLEDSEAFMDGEAPVSVHVAVRMHEFERARARDRDIEFQRWPQTEPSHRTKIAMTNTQ